MAPESFLDFHSTATDVYAAAVVLFELFTGHHPFNFSLSPSATPKEIAEVVRRSRQSGIPKVTDFNNQLSPRWDDFFHEALAHDYEARPKDAAVLLQLFNETDAAAEHLGELRLSEEVAGLVEKAMRLSQQAVTLNEAIQVLDEACAMSSAARSEYGNLLSLWKAGVIG